ncbi:hypothetical protein [Mycolicibacter arupensis]|jgi:hypothetical protein|uniref:Uncharacterized protein n=1 Tax=Mycolicibacter arupensis TaxID=342002 RepID=A0A5C7Y9A3_9MYCO|nr:hypothetical protein [Mycolicibacter arupensis]TXI57978.1 MAG: hypothetical protein E6Q54_06800 [Mycolicibacter arupensis]
MSEYLSPSDAAWVERVRSAATNPDPEPEPGFDTNTDPAEPDTGEQLEVAPDASDCADDARPQETATGDGETGDDGADADAVKARRRFNPMVAAAFGGLAVVATLVTVIGASVSSRTDPQPPPAPTPVAKPAPPAPPAAKPPASVDEPLRFTATSDCDSLPGSTPAALLSDPKSTVPMICASEVAGEIVHLYLDQPHIITAVCIVPGAVNKSADGESGDAWERHRVVTRLQAGFNDRANTIKVLNTHNKHGEHCEAVPHPLASEITIVIQETSRPPKTAPTTSTPAAPPAGGGVLSGILGGSNPPPGLPSNTPLFPGDTSDRPDPSDGSFAISGITIIGHPVI